MNNKIYQKLTNTTNTYPIGKMIDCLAHGLSSEAGEVSGVLKKHYRGDFDFTEVKDKIKKELGDVLWYASELCNHLGFTIDEVMELNIEKLRDRYNRGAIKGSGDDR